MAFVQLIALSWQDLGDVYVSCLAIKFHKMQAWGIDTYKSVTSAFLYDAMASVSGVPHQGLPPLKIRDIFVTLYYVVSSAPRCQSIY